MVGSVISAGVVVPEARGEVRRDESEASPTSVREGIRSSESLSRSAESFAAAIDADVEERCFLPPFRESDECRGQVHPLCREWTTLGSMIGWHLAEKNTSLTFSSHPDVKRCTS